MLISVIIPYTEDRGYLCETLESLHAQTFKNFEIIHAKGPYSQSENNNRGVARAIGDYIKILHDDDTLPPTALEDLYEAVQGFDWVCGDAQTFGDSIYCPEPKIYHGCLPKLEKMIEKNQVYGGTTLYRREIVRYNEVLLTGEEYELHLRLLKNDYKVNYIAKVVHNYRLHEFNKSYYMGEGEKRERRDHIRWIADGYR